MNTPLQVAPPILKDRCDGLLDEVPPTRSHRKAPTSNDLSIQSVELWFLPTDYLDNDKRKDHTPKAVGSLGLRDGQLTGLLSTPKDALTPILQMLIAGRFKFVDLGGAKLRYREALVRSFQARDPHRRGRLAVGRRET